MAVASLARRIVLTGGTDHLGCRLIPLLIDRGHFVRALTRERSRYARSSYREVVSDTPLNSAAPTGVEHLAKSKKGNEDRKNWTPGGVER